MIDQKYLKECMKYSNGLFTWRDRPLHHFSHCKNPLQICNKVNSQMSGELAGYERKGRRTKYLQINITIDGRMKGYCGHRLAWLYVYGHFPDGDLDHIDGDGLNNLIDNLRIVDDLENVKNQRMNINNSSGFNGVYWHKGKCKWCALIRVDSRLIHGGTFPNKNDAIECRKKLNVKYGFHELHGQIKKGDYK